MIVLKVSGKENKGQKLSLRVEIAHGEAYQNDWPILYSKVHSS